MARKKQAQVTQLGMWQGLPLAETTVGALNPAEALQVAALSSGRMAMGMLAKKAMTLRLMRK